MHVETFKNDVIFLIDTGNITPSDQRIIVQITDTYQLSRQNFEQGVGIRVIVNR